MSQARFQKQQREKARREKAAAKWARKAERADRPDGEAADGAVTPTAVDEEVVLAELAELHDRFEAGDVTFEDFEEAKDLLMERLHVQ